MKITPVCSNNQNKYKNKAADAATPSFGTLNINKYINKSSTRKNIRLNLIDSFKCSGRDSEILFKRLKHQIGILNLKFSDDNLPTSYLKSLEYSKDGRAVVAQIKLPERLGNIYAKMGGGHSVYGSSKIFGVDNVPFYSLEAIENGYGNAGFAVKALKRIDSLFGKNKLMRKQFNSKDYLKTFSVLDYSHPDKLLIFARFLQGVNSAMERIPRRARLKVLSVYIDKTPHPHMPNEIWQGQYNIRAVVKARGLKEPVTVVSPQMNAYNGNGQIVGAVQNNAYESIITACRKAIHLRKEMKQLP